MRVLQILEGIGPAHASRCLEHVAAESHSLQALEHFDPPPAAKLHWPKFKALMVGLSAHAGSAGSGWQRDVAEARQWYQPYLEQHYEAAPQRLADLEQLEQIAGGYPSRDRFLAELTLDPPQSSGER